MDYLWFFFGLIEKALTNYMAQYTTKYKGEFDKIYLTEKAEQFEKKLMKISDIIPNTVTFNLEKLDKEYIRFVYANHSFGEFIRSLLYYWRLGKVADVIENYTRKISAKFEASYVKGFASFRYLPFLFKFDILNMIKDFDYLYERDCAGKLQFDQTADLPDVMQNEHFFHGFLIRNYISLLMNDCKSKVNESNSNVNRLVCEMAILSIASLIEKYDIYKHFEKKKEDLASLLFPLISIVIEERKFFEKEANIPFGVITEQTKLTESEMRHIYVWKLFYVCIIWVLKNIEKETLQKYFNREVSTRLCDLLFHLKNGVEMTTKILPKKFSINNLYDDLRVELINIIIKDMISVSEKKKITEIPLLSQRVSREIPKTPDVSIDTSIIEQSLSRRRGTIASINEPFPPQQQQEENTEIFEKIEENHINLIKKRSNQKSSKFKDILIQSSSSNDSENATPSVERKQKKKSFQTLLTMSNFTISESDGGNGLTSSTKKSDIFSKPKTEKDEEKEDKDFFDKLKSIKPFQTIQNTFQNTILKQIKQTVGLGSKKSSSPTHEQQKSIDEESSEMIDENDNANETTNENSSNKDETTNTILQYFQLRSVLRTIMDCIDVLFYERQDIRGDLAECLSILIETMVTKTQSQGIIVIPNLEFIFSLITKHKESILESEHLSHCLLRSLLIMIQWNEKYLKSFAIRLIFLLLKSEFIDTQKISFTTSNLVGLVAKLQIEDSNKFRTTLEDEMKKICKEYKKENKKTFSKAISIAQENALDSLTWMKRLNQLSLGEEIGIIYDLCEFMYKCVEIGKKISIDAFKLKASLSNDNTFIIKNIYIRLFKIIPFGEDFIDAMEEYIHSKFSEDVINRLMHAFRRMKKCIQILEKMLETIEDKIKN